MTPGLVTLDLKRDIPLPRNVRRYFFPSTSHGGGHGGFAVDSAWTAAPGVCMLPPNPNPQDDQMRALLVALTEWISKGTEPPASRFPTIAGKELVRDVAGELKVPNQRDVPQPFGIANPLLLYDYGPEFDHENMSGAISQMPPFIRRSIPARVPQVDLDGNEIGGVPSVHAMAPLGSYLSWNVLREGPYAGRICSGNGGFIPFAKTRAARLARADKRESIEERYGSAEGYIAAVKQAVDIAMRERFLLAEDANRLLEEAETALAEGDLQFLRRHPES